ncbi:hypothetical protein P7C71_g964, partial [Lecanoromycetidae sp. Uapishka_2]
MMYGRQPVHHPWPMGHCLAKVDISDPHTFLTIKRGILQYAWLKPILGLATIIMKATGTYQEGYIGLTSGYLWSGIFYNVSVTDYADATISAARMPVKYALRDAFGPRDLIEDTKETFGGKHYEYRVFDTGDNVLAHEESESRAARMLEGMRFERGGKGKYWIPKPGEINSRTPLLSGGPGPSRAATMSYSKSGRDLEEDHETEVEEAKLDAEDERLFTTAKALEFGDWNYPVITAHVPAAERWLGADPELITTSTNRNLLQPTKANRERRESNIQKVLDKSRHTADSGSDKGEASRSKPKGRSRAPVANGILREESSSDQSVKTGRSQLVDLIIEDTQAEEVERVRARKEGGSAWNDTETKQYIRTYDDENEGQVVREGFEPSKISRASNSSFVVGDDDDEPGNVGKMQEESEEARDWVDGENQAEGRSAPESNTHYGSLENPWNARDGENA